MSVYKVCIREDEKYTAGDEEVVAESFRAYTSGLYFYADGDELIRWYPLDTVEMVFKMESN